MTLRPNWFLFATFELGLSQMLAKCRQEISIDKIVKITGKKGISAAIITSYATSWRQNGHSADKPVDVIGAVGQDCLRWNQFSPVQASCTWRSVAVSLQNNNIERHWRQCGRLREVVEKVDARWKRIVASVAVNRLKLWRRVADVVDFF